MTTVDFLSARYIHVWSGFPGGDQTGQSQREVRHEIRLHGGTGRHMHFQKIGRRVLVESENIAKSVSTTKLHGLRGRKTDWSNIRLVDR